jgi:hypothetical protein
MYTVGLPNAFCASDRVSDTAGISAASVCTHAHAPPAAAPGRLDDDGIADTARDAHDSFGILGKLRRPTRARKARRPSPSRPCALT